MHLIESSLEIKESYLDFVSEWEKSGEVIIPASADPKGMSFEAWMAEALALKNQATCPPNFVPASTYFLVDDNHKILGAINIRHYLNDFLVKRGGNIGYGVRLSERKKGIASLMLKLGLEKCKALNMKRVLITCDKENTGSVKTILANGGILENEIIEDDRITQRYWINLQ